MRARHALACLAVLALSACATFPSARRAFRDCPSCPEMIVVPPGRVGVGDDRVRTLSKPIAVGRIDVTREQFEAFLKSTDYGVGVNCRTFEGGVWADRSVRNPLNPGFAQSPSDPAVCVTWLDARSYTAWLNGLLGLKGYRLATTAELDYFAAAGIGPPPPRSPKSAAASPIDRPHDILSEWSGDCTRFSSHPVGACLARARVARGADGRNLPGDEAPPLTRDAATGFRVVKDLVAEGRS